MDKKAIEKFLESYVDLYGDGYITKNNLRLAIKENVDLLFECIEKGDKLFVEEKGFAVVLGFSDNASRKYIKILSDNKLTIKYLLQGIFKEVKETLYIKIKKNNPLKYILEKEGFKIKGFRGKEILLVKTIRL